MTKSDGFKCCFNGMLNTWRASFLLPKTSMNSYWMEVYLLMFSNSTFALRLLEFTMTSLRLDASQLHRKCRQAGPTFSRTLLFLSLCPLCWSLSLSLFFPTSRVRACVRNLSNHQAPQCRESTMLCMIITSLVLRKRTRLKSPFGAYLPLTRALKPLCELNGRCPIRITFGVRRESRWTRWLWKLDWTVKKLNFGYSNTKACY